MSDLLKPCPHCGGAAYLEQNYARKTRTFFVYGKCSICGAQGKIFYSDDEPEASGWEDSASNAAAAAWNSRVKEQEVTANAKSEN